MFVLSFKNGDDDRRGDSFDLYYLRLVEINDCNALIDNKPFFDQPLKSKQETYRKTCQNVRKWYLYSSKLKFFISSKLL